MTDPTDTNQASEDERMGVVLDELELLSNGRFYDFDTRETAKKTIQAIIRTEQKKLLAAAREQTVAAAKGINPNNKDFYDGYRLAIAEYLDVLNKLETEL